jgi:hypothetical protein
MRETLEDAHRDLTVAGSGSKRRAFAVLLKLKRALLERLWIRTGANVVQMS